MISINIQEAKTHLSRYARRVKAGETIILCERNEPFAEIRPLPKRRKVKLGVLQGYFEVPEDFNAALKGFEDAFYGD
jgi:antitoxin (DNA-binding transcriptional repressor) of toxin-antitoxin stability system